MSKIPRLRKLAERHGPFVAASVVNTALAVLAGWFTWRADAPVERRDFESAFVLAAPKSEPAPVAPDSAISGYDGIARAGGALVTGPPAAGGAGEAVPASALRPEAGVLTQRRERAATRPPSPASRYEYGASSRLGGHVTGWLWITRRKLWITPCT